jgi:hypothetical protein
LRPGAHTLRRRHSVLVQVAGNSARGLALGALPQNAGHDVVWRRPRSAEDDTVVPSHHQRLPCTASDEVALKLREDHSQRERVAAVEKEIAQIAARAEQAIAEVRQIAFVRSLETPVGAWMSASPKMRARRR